jgi:hypothetical protein
VATSQSRADFVLERLQHFAAHATPADGQKIRATELLGKTVGMFRDVVVDDRQDMRDEEQIRAEMKAVLAKLEAMQASSKPDDKPIQNKSETVQPLRLATG